MPKLIVAIEIGDNIVGKGGVNENLTRDELKTLPRGSQVVLDEVIIERDSFDDSFLVFEFVEYEE